jgi:hypothetical protein
MTRTLPLALAALVLAAPAGASIPGNEEPLARAGLQHVCVDVEPDDEGYVPCNEQEGANPTNAYTGAECVAAGLPPVCVVDNLPKTILKAKLFLIQDQDAEDSGGGFESAAGFVLEVKIKGKKHTLVELFDGGADGTQIGNWNDLFEAFLADPSQTVDFGNDAGTVFQFANQSLANVGLAIRDLAHAAWPQRGIDGAIPVFLDIARGDADDIVDHSEFGDLLATGAPFDLRIGFARVRP